MRFSNNEKDTDEHIEKWEIYADINCFHCPAAVLTVSSMAKVLHAYFILFIYFY